LVDVTVSGSSRSGQVTWVDPAPLPQTRGYCLRTEVDSYVWDKGAVGGAGSGDAPSVFLAAQRATGIWTGAFCMLPRLGVTPPGGLSTFHRYRYAIAARLNSGTGGAYTTQNVRLTVTCSSGSCGGGTGAGGSSP